MEMGQIRRARCSVGGLTCVNGREAWWIMVMCMVRKKERKKEVIYIYILCNIIKMDIKKLNGSDVCVCD